MAALIFDFDALLIGHLFGSMESDHLWEALLTVVVPSLEHIELAARV